jgi:hypothetical protein
MRATRPTLILEERALARVPTDEGQAAAAGALWFETAAMRPPHDEELDYHP